MLKCASFFAGVGGIDIGFEKTGKFEVIYANEIDPYPVKTYELNSAIKKYIRKEKRRLDKLGQMYTLFDKNNALNLVIPNIF